MSIRKLILCLGLAAGLAPAFAAPPPPVPALPDTERRISYSISGTTCACSLGSQLQLYGDGTDYQNWVEVWLNGVQVQYNDPTFGWTITSPSGPLANLSRPITNAVLTFNSAQTGTVQIIGARRPRRASQFNENQGVAARDFNQALTDLVAQNRETWDKINDITGRGFFAPPGQTGGVISGPLSGVISGPASSTDGGVAIWNGTSGAALKDGGGGHAIAHPSSGNLVGGGCVTSEAHSLWWVDQNLCATGDSWQWVSNDPSALAVITLGGSFTTNDVITLTFVYGANTINITYTVKVSDTSASVVSGLVAAIQANATLFNNTQVQGAFGTVAQGGYTGGYQIGYISAINSTQFAFDWNSLNSMVMSYSVSGSATETITFPAGWFAGNLISAGTSTGSANAQAIVAAGFTLSSPYQAINFTAGFSNSGSTTLNAQSTGAKTIKKYVNGALANLSGGEIVAGTNYTVHYDGVEFVLGYNAIYLSSSSTANSGFQLPNALDNNPAFVTGRAPGGVPPAPGSAIFALYATAAATGNQPTQRTINYGVIADWVLNASTGALQDAWLIQNANGGGTYFGNGVYSNFGCAGVGDPTTAGCVLDKGAGTFNAGAGYWISGTNNGNGAELYKNGSTIRLDTFSTGWPIVINGSGVGVNAVPTGSGEFNSALGGFFSGSQVPATGTGTAIGMNAGNGYVIAENFATSTFQQLILQGSIVALAPNGNGANGVQVISNELYPPTDNQVLLGDTATPHRFASVAAMAYKFGGSSSGNTTVQASATASGTLTLPAATDTLTGKATTDTLSNKTIDTAAPNTIKVNGVDISTAWSSFTPSYTCGVPGTFAATNTSSTAKTAGKTTSIQIDFTITNLGTCTSEIDFTLPNTPATSGTIPIFDTTNVTAGICFWITTSTTARCFKTGGGNFTTVRFVGSGVYQNQ